MATGWMAGALLEDESTEALILLRRSIAELYAVGDGVNLTVALQIALAALVRHGHHRDTAEVTGALLKVSRGYGARNSPSRPPIGSAYVGTHPRGLAECPISCMPIILSPFR